MIRLFVGLDPSDSVKDQLLLLMGGLSGARWQRREQLHLTLRFIGEVDGHQAQDIAAALTAVRMAPFDVTLAGIGLFDRRGRPESLWVGAEPEAQLRSLHNKIGQALVRTGLPPETRQYRPHVTLARLPARIGGLDVFLSGAAGFRALPFRASALCLYRSTLTADGAHYDILQTCPLD